MFFFSMYPLIILQSHVGGVGQLLAGFLWRLAAVLHHDSVIFHVFGQHAINDACITVHILLIWWCVRYYDSFNKSYYHLVANNWNCIPHIDQYVAELCVWSDSVDIYKTNTGFIADRVLTGNRFSDAIHKSSFLCKYWCILGLLLLCYQNNFLHVTFNRK